MHPHFRMADSHHGAGPPREKQRQQQRTDFSVKGLVESGPVATGSSSDPLAIATSKQIAAIEFGTMSGMDMMRASTLQVCSRELYKMPQRSPAPHGCLDPRLGISNKNDACGTCGRKLAECAGHFGHIVLELPVFHIGFLKAVVEILQNICKTCSRVLLAASDRGKYRASMRAPTTDALRKTRFRKIITDLCKKATVCPFCGAHNGQVRVNNHCVVLCQLVFVCVADVHLCRFPSRCVPHTGLGKEGCWCTRLQNCP